MKAICENELVIDCAGYKAIDSGVVLTRDEEKKEVVAFVPNEKLAYLLPDDVVEREHERLGLPAPEIASAEELETRLVEFAGELDDLREILDQQVEEMIDAGALDEGEFERQEHLRERRRTVDRLLQQVRQRADQFRQLSAIETEAPAIEEGTAAEDEESVESLRAELDERLETIEAQLDELSTGTGGESEEAAAGAEAEEPDAGSLDEISGLGPTYRDRLEDEGIETLRDLAARAPEDVADAAKTSQSRARQWIERAEDRLEEEAAA